MLSKQHDEMLAKRLSAIPRSSMHSHHDVWSDRYKRKRLIGTVSFTEDTGNEIVRTKFCYAFELLENWAGADVGTEAQSRTQVQALTSAWRCRGLGARVQDMPHWNLSDSAPDRGLVDGGP